MAQRRKNVRYKVVGEVVGRFGNDESCVLLDYNLDGLQLMSGFPPLVGSRYSLRLTDMSKNSEESFQVEVTRVSAGGYNMKTSGVLPVGTIYKVGVRLLNAPLEKEKFLKGISHF